MTTDDPTSARRTTPTTGFYEQLSLLDDAHEEVPRRRPTSTASPYKDWITAWDEIKG